MQLQSKQGSEVGEGGEVGREVGRVGGWEGGREGGQSWKRGFEVQPSHLISVIRGWAIDRLPGRSLRRTACSSIKLGKREAW